MIFFNCDPAIDAVKTVVHAATAEEVKATPAGSLVVMPFDRSALSFYKTAGIPLAIRVGSVKEYLLIMGTGATYALASKALAPALQKIAEEYLSDTKVIVEIENEDQIPWAAARGIDGVFVA